LRVCENIFRREKDEILLSFFSTRVSFAFVYLR